MRVIGGTVRGRRLEAPKGRSVRPTLDRVRESLFNILAPTLAGARFLDLFAGSGANGIEALSRGATACTFVDSDARALGVVRKNLDATGLQERARVMRLTLPAGLERLSREDDGYNVVFADPPYAFADYEALLTGLRRWGLVAEDGLIVVEHASRVVLPDEVGEYGRTRSNRYGEASLSFYR